jgi:hypothetical protein
MQPNLLVDRLNLFRHFFARRGHRPRRDRLLVQILDQFRCAFHRNKMIHIEIRHLRPHAHSILRFLRYVRWKLGLISLPAQRAGLGFRLMLGDFQPDFFRQVKDLSPFNLLRRQMFQHRSTLSTAFHRMNQGMLRLGNWLQPSTHMSDLTACLLPTAMAQTMGGGFLVPIATGRFATVVAVFVLLIFQRLKLGLQCAVTS